MIRQARIYLAGAVSGTMLIAVAVVAFTMLVSLQTVRDWPLGGLTRGGEGSDSAVAPGRPAAAGPGGVEAVAGTGGAGAPAATGGSNGDGGSNGEGGSATNTGAGVAPPDSSAPVANAPAGAAPGSTPGARGGGSTPSRSRNGSSSGGNSATEPSSNGGNLPVTETATGAVNDTVSGVDSATGGALGAVGVTSPTEEAAKGVSGAGPATGRSVGSPTDAVDGLLDGDR